MGANDEERARILMWNTKVEQQGLLAVADGFRNVAKGLKNRAMTGPVSYEQLSELAERGRDRVAQFFQRLDGHLADTKFLAGASYSIADISAMVTVDFAARIKVELPEDSHNVRRWYEAVSSRPSASV